MFYFVIGFIIVLIVILTIGCVFLLKALLTNKKADEHTMQSNPSEQKYSPKASDLGNENFDAFFLADEAERVRRQAEEQNRLFREQQQRDIDLQNRLCREQQKIEQQNQWMLEQQHLTEQQNLQNMLDVHQNNDWQNFNMPNMF